MFGDDEDDFDLLPEDDIFIDGSSFPERRLELDGEALYGSGEEEIEEGPSETSLSEVLLSFKRAVDVDDSVEFQQFVGLDGIVPADSFQDLLFGDALPGNRLFKYFEGILPEAVCSQEDLIVLDHAIKAESRLGKEIVEVGIPDAELRRRITLARERIEHKLGINQEAYRDRDLLARHRDDILSAGIVGEFDDFALLDLNADSRPPTQRGKRGARSERTERARKLAAETKPDEVDLTEKAKRMADALGKILSVKDDQGRVIYGERGEPLRQSQQEALEAFHAHLLEGGSLANWVLPGGAGKSRIELLLAEAAINAGLRPLIIKPSRLGVDGVDDERKEISPHVDLGRIYAGAFEKDATAIVCTYASLIKNFYSRLIAGDKGKASKSIDIADFDFIMTDEAHGFITELSGLIFSHSGALRGGHTATPAYSKEKKVSDAFGPTIYEVTLEQTIERDECAPLEWQKCLINEGDENNAVIGLYSKWVSAIDGEPVFGRKTFVFRERTKDCDELAQQINRELTPLLKDARYRKLLESRGIDSDKVKAIAAPVHRSLLPDPVHTDHEVKRRLAMYERGEILMLVSADLLIQSYNSTATSLVIDGDEGKSPVRGGQKGLRASRTHPGKDGFSVLNLVKPGFEERRVFLFAHYANDVLIREESEGRANKDAAEQGGEEVEDSAVDRIFGGNFDARDQDIPGVISMDGEWDLDSALDIFKEKATRRKTGATSNLSYKELAEKGYINIRYVGKAVDGKKYRLASSAMTHRHLESLVKEGLGDPLPHGEFQITARGLTIRCMVDDFGSGNVIYFNKEDIKAYLEGILPTKDEKLRTPEQILKELQAEGYRIQTIGELRHARRISEYVRDEVGVAENFGTAKFEIETEHGPLVGRLHERSSGNIVTLLEPKAGKEFAKKLLRLQGKPIKIPDGFVLATPRILKTYIRDEGNFSYVDNDVINQVIAIFGSEVADIGEIKSKNIEGVEVRFVKLNGTGQVVTAINVEDLIKLFKEKGYARQDRPVVVSAEHLTLGQAARVLEDSGLDYDPAKLAKVYAGARSVPVGINGMIKFGMDVSGYSVEVMPVGESDGRKPDAALVATDDILFLARSGRIRKETKVEQEFVSAADIWQELREGGKTISFMRVQKLFFRLARIVPSDYELDNTYTSTYQGAIARNIDLRYAIHPDTNEECLYAEREALMEIMRAERIVAAPRSEHAKEGEREVVSPIP